MIATTETDVTGPAVEIAAVRATDPTREVARRDEPIPDGIYFDMPASVYRAERALSQSAMSNMDPPARLPAYWANPIIPTPAMRMGTMVHQRILEPKTPLPRIALKPPTYPAPAHHADVKKGTIKAGDPLKWSGNAKWCQDWEAKQIELGNDIMKPEELDTLVECVDAVRNNEDSAKVFAAGRSEVSLFRTFQLRSGRWVRIKARIDWDGDGDFLADIKKVQKFKAAQEEFESLVFDRRYHVQAAFYLDMWNAMVGPEHQKKTWIWTVVEEAAPYLVANYLLSDEQYQAGRDTYEADLETFARCSQSGVWPGFPSGFRKLCLPGWARRKMREAML